MVPALVEFTILWVRVTLKERLHDIRIQRVKYHGRCRRLRGNVSGSQTESGQRGGSLEEGTLMLRCTARAGAWKGRVGHGRKRSGVNDLGGIHEDFALILKTMDGLRMVPRVEGLGQVCIWRDGTAGENANGPQVDEGPSGRTG